MIPEEIIHKVKVSDTHRDELKRYIINDENLEFNKVLDSSRKSLTELVSIFIKDYFIGEKEFDYLMNLKAKYPDSINIVKKTINVTVPESIREEIKGYVKRTYDKEIYFHSYSCVRLTENITYPKVGKINDIEIPYEINIPFLKSINVPESLIDTFYAEIRNATFAVADKEHFLDKYDAVWYGYNRRLGVFKTWGDVLKTNKDWYKYLCDNFLEKDSIQKECEELINREVSRTKSGNKIVNDVLSKIYELGKHCNII